MQIPSFYFKDNLQKINLEKKSYFLHFLDPENVQNGFWLLQVKTKIKFSFSSFLDLKKIKKTFSLCRLKKCSIHGLGGNRLTGKQNCGCGLGPKLKSNKQFKVKPWNWGPVTIWHIMTWGKLSNFLTLENNKNETLCFENYG